MNKVDYGPAPQELVDLLENLRSNLSSDKRLIMIKLLARTIMTDGDSEEQKVASTVDLFVTTHFKERYHEQG